MPGEQDLHSVLFAAQNRLPTQRSFLRKEVLREDVRDASRCSCAELSRRNLPPQQNPAPAPTRLLSSRANRA